MFATIKNFIPEPRQVAQPRHYVGRHRDTDAIGPAAVDDGTAVVDGPTQVVDEPAQNAEPGHDAQPGQDAQEPSTAGGADLPAR